MSWKPNQNLVILDYGVSNIPSPSSSCFARIALIAPCLINALLNFLLDLSLLQLA